MITYPKYKVAVAQIAPVWLDLDASVDKAIEFIKDAAKNGAKLIAFPEGYLPGYPWWIFYGDPFAYGLKYWDEFYRNAVEIPSKTVCKTIIYMYVCRLLRRMEAHCIFHNYGSIIQVI